MNPVSSSGRPILSLHAMGIERILKLYFLHPRWETKREFPIGGGEALDQSLARQCLKPIAKLSESDN